MVADAQRSRAPHPARMADKVAGIFVPVVIVIAVVAFIVAWALVGPDPKLAHALIVAVAVLIIACPCAPGWPPHVDHGRVGRGAGLGVLIKKRRSPERMEKVDTPWSTRPNLTEGRPTVTNIVTASEHSPDDLLRLAAGVERASEHPLALAIVEAATVRSPPVPDVTNFDSPVGRGVIGTVEGQVLVLGSSGPPELPPHRHH